MIRNFLDSPRVGQAYERALFVITALAVGLAAFNRVRPGGGATLSDAFLVLAAVLLLPRIAFSPRRFVMLPLWLLLSAGLFAVASALTVVFPAAPSKAALYFPGGPLSLLPAEAAESASNLGVLIRLELALLLVPFVIVQVGTSWRRLSQLANVWLAALVFSGVIGIIAYIGHIHLAGLIGGAPGAEVTRVKGFTTHPNVFGDTAAIAIPTAAGFGLTSAGRRRWYYLFVVLVLLGAVGVSGSRAAILGTVVGVCALALLDRASRKLLLRVVVGAVALGLVVGLAALNSVPVIQRIVGNSDVNVANEERGAIYSKVWSEIEHRPIVGHGFEYLVGPHDLYLQVLHAGGVIALVALLAILFGVSNIGYRVSGTDREAVLTRALAASSLAWLLGTGLFDPAIYDRYLYVPVALLIGCWAVAKRSRPSTST